MEAQITTSRGTIVLDLFTGQTPVTVANFINLASRKFYEGVTFHRVIADFMVQGGDPTGTGRGGPGYQFKDECLPELAFNQPGRLAMANAGPNTNGSQFFITHVPTPWLNGKHTIFGQVRTGQEVVDSIKQGEKIDRIEISGDYKALFDEQKAHIESWNRTLGKAKA